MTTSILILVVILLLWVVYQLDMLEHRIDRMHAKVNAIRKAVVPSEPQSDAEVASRHSVTDTIRALKHS